MTGAIIEAQDLVKRFGPSPAGLTRPSRSSRVSVAYSCPNMSGRA